MFFLLGSGGGWGEGLNVNKNPCLLVTKDALVVTKNALDVTGDIWRVFGCQLARTLFGDI